MGDPILRLPCKLGILLFGRIPLLLRGTGRSPMRRAGLWSILQLAVLTSPISGQAFSQDRQTTTVAMRPHHGTRVIVGVKVNGAGPYDFMVDTGATYTVVDADLMEQLRLPIEGPGTIHSMTGVSAGWRSEAREITVGDLTVRNVDLVSMMKPLPGSGIPHIRGILGENFLNHFDLLIDNQHRQVSLDIGAGLATSLSGDHLVISSASRAAERGEYLRPRVTVTIEDVGEAKVLLDSGANELILFRWGSPFSRAIDGNGLEMINGKLPCNSEQRTVHFSRHNVSTVDVATCLTAAARPGSNEGLLPTAIFKQVFISFAASYVIINPVVSQRGIGSRVSFTASSR
jgi:gag-polyprotein putative aspartyl protease